MTREELFSAFRRPWRLLDEEPGVILDANGAEIVRVLGPDGTFEEDQSAMAEIIVDLVNAAEE